MSDALDIPIGPGWWQRDDSDLGFVKGATQFTVYFPYFGVRNGDVLFQWGTGAKLAALPITEFKRIFGGKWRRCEPQDSVQETKLVIREGRAMNSALNPLRQFIDRKAYQWLDGIDPEAIAFIEQCVADGISPDEIRDTVAKTCSAYGGEYADLCRSASRHVKAQKQRA